MSEIRSLAASTVLSSMLLGASALSPGATAHAQDRPFLLIRDDGSLTNAISTVDQLTADVQYIFEQHNEAEAALGVSRPVPNLLSVWTTFPSSGGGLGTFYFPVANHLTGLGLEWVYTTAAGAAADGTFSSPSEPLQAVLLHDDFVHMATRAARSGSPVEGYARYLFLLELSHVWGPSIRTLSATPDELIGFPFHWSFFVDAGGGLAGGNRFEDLGAGRFRVLRADPATMAFSPLDLYLMGLVPASEVAPFGLLTPTSVPATPVDPGAGAPVNAGTFPWMGPEELVIEATRREITIDEVIEANGPRMPVFGDAPTELAVTFVLVAAADMNPAELAATEAEFGAFVDSLDEAYADATGDRGSLAITRFPVPGASYDAGRFEDAAAAVDAGAPDAGTSAPTSGCACRASSRPDGVGAAWLGLGLALVLLGRRR